jgi:ribosomal protein S5
MQANTQSVTVDAPVLAVYEFLSNAENLPRWAIGFAKGIRAAGDHWVVQTGQTEVALTVAADSTTGVVDFRMEPAPGVEAVAFSRVVPNGAGAEYVFTQFQGSGTSAEIFEAMVKALSHELVVLKALLEVECPL